MSPAREESRRETAGRSARVSSNIICFPVGVGHFCREGRIALLFHFSGWCFMVGRYQITPVKRCPGYALLHTADGTGTLVFLQNLYCLSCPKEQNKQR